MDESGLNQGSADPTSKWYVFFHLTGPGVDQKLTADMTSESFDQHPLFDFAHKECRIQTNVKTQIPATFNGGPYPTGNYTIFLKAWDNDQTREGGDLGTQTWKFTVSPGPSPSPTPSATPTSQTSPSSGVLAASTTGPGLPKTGAGASGPGPNRSIDVAALFALALVGLSGLVAARTRRSRERSKP